MGYIVRCRYCNRTFETDVPIYDIHNILAYNHACSGCRRDQGIKTIKEDKDEKESNEKSKASSA